jgi:hypothetical protein
MLPPVDPTTPNFTPATIATPPVVQSGSTVLEQNLAALDHSDLFPGTTPSPAPVVPSPTGAVVNPVIAEAKQLLQPAARLWLYGVCVAAIPLLVAFGKITGDQASLWTDFAASVLGVSGLTVAIANVKR